MNALPASPLLAAVGPLSLGEHLLWFVVMSLLAFLVYAGLREEDVGRAARQGVVGWLRFCVGSALLFGAFSALSAWL